MTHPRKVQVGPFVYTVSSDQAEMAAAVREDRKEMFGRTDHAALRILLEPTQTEPRMRDTLLHEVLHTLTTLTGLDMELGQDEEGMVNRMAPALLDVMRRNPQLVAYLTS